jgi:tRNA pseudouridine38-40 synthase
MPRIALGLEYDGTDFVGWQTQRHGRTIETVLAQAVTAVAAEPVTVHAAGRTDAGVHALQQVVHFDARAARTLRQWHLGINSNLPPDVAVRWVRQVPEDFDARRSAIARRYRYTIAQQPYRPALGRRRAWWVREPLDCGAMSAAAVHWLGEHDFSTFRAAGCQSRSAVRRLTALDVARRTHADGALVTVELKANAFLQHMCRNLVGTLVEIGRGELAPGAAAALLSRRDRTAAGVSAPPQGLVLLEVLYPAHYEIPALADE